MRKWLFFCAVSVVFTLFPEFSVLLCCVHSAFFIPSSFAMRGLHGVAQPQHSFMSSPQKLVVLDANAYEGQEWREPLLGHNPLDYFDHAELRGNG